MGRIFTTKVYVHPDAPRTFRTEHDLRGWCLDNGKDPTYIMGFDSHSEYARWLELLDMERRGEISELRRQVEYELTPDICEQVPDGFTTLRTWCVDGNRFERKRDAVAYCREHGIRQKDIECVSTKKQRWRKVAEEKASHYTADFVYRRADGTEVVEDVKSSYTRREKDYILRRKFLRWRWGIKIYEHVVK